MGLWAQKFNKTKSDYKIFLKNSVIYGEWRNLNRRNYANQNIL